MNRKNIDQSSLEIIIGLVLMFSSWLTILLIVIDFINISRLLGPQLVIAISIICYVSSVIGLGLSTHGLFTRLAKSKSKQY